MDLEGAGWGLLAAHLGGGRGLLMPLWETETLTPVF